MILTVIGLLIGVMVLGIGLYYRIREKNDPESRKIYGIISGIGGILFVVMLVKLIVTSAG